MKKGFTLVEIMIVVAIIGILVAIAVPGFLRARETSRARACQENLSKIDGAKENYALDNNLGEAGTVAWSDIVTGKTGYIRKQPSCPAGGSVPTAIAVPDRLPRALPVRGARPPAKSPARRAGH